MSNETFAAHAATDGEAALTFLTASSVPECNQTLDKHVVGYYTLQFMERGGVDLAYDDHWTRMDDGRAWFWPAYPGPRLRFHAAPGCDTWFHRHIAFKGPLVARWIAGGLWPTDAQPAPDTRNYAAVFDELTLYSRRADRWGKLRAVNLLERLLIELAEARATHSATTNQPAAHPPWLADVLARLTDNETFAPPYAQIARSVAGVSESAMRRHFKAAMGVSPHAYALASRIARAKTLLTETDLPLKTVAERLGYDNVYFFARQFKQEAGVPPGVFRRSRL